MPTSLKPRSFKMTLTPDDQLRLGRIRMALMKTDATHAVTDADCMRHAMMAADPNKSSAVGSANRTKRRK